MQPVPAGFAANAVVIGNAEMGPLANGARAVALVNPVQFEKQARLATPISLKERNPVLAHILDVENEIVKAADRLRPRAGQFALKTQFPGGAFGTSIKTAMQVLAATDTPAGMPQTGQGCRGDPPDAQWFRYPSEPAGSACGIAQAVIGGNGCDALGAGRTGPMKRDAHHDLCRVWRAAPREPEQRHGSRHGRVAFRDGRPREWRPSGVAPELARLDGTGNLPVGVDFRQVYATVLGPCGE